MVKLSQIKSNMPPVICAIDASTNSLAFALFDTQQKRLGTVGKIMFKGNTTYEKVADACIKTRDFFNHYGGFDTIIIEQTIYANSPKTAAHLALVQGAILGAASLNGVNKIGSTSPMVWQNYIGNKKLTTAEKQEISEQFPDKSKSWLKNHERTVRKQRTINFINTYYDRNISDDDIADACGLGHWALHNWDKVFNY